MTAEIKVISTLGSQNTILQQVLPVEPKSKIDQILDNVVRINFDNRQDVSDSGKLSNESDDSDSVDSLTNEQLENSILKLNSSDQFVSRNLEFHIDTNSGRTVITVRDTESHSIIRQIPSDQALETTVKLQALQESYVEQSTATGILFSEQT